MSAQVPAHYPVNLDLQGRPCLVIGAGSIATRKIQTLLKFGAKVTVHAPEATQTLRTLAQKKKIRLVTGKYKSSLVKNMALIFAATDDEKVNKQVYRDATARGILVNVADQVDLCNFIAPAIVKRGSLVIAISTAGTGPVLARYLREEFEKIFDTKYAILLKKMHAQRKVIQKKLGSMNQKRRYWRQFMHDTAHEIGLVLPGKKNGTTARRAVI